MGVFMSDIQFTKNEADRVSYGSIVANTALSALKFFCGIFGHSRALISDAVHSLSDVLATFIVIIGMSMSAKDADDEHRYGHERMECIAANILSVILFATGAGIGLSGIRSIITKSYLTARVPSGIALFAAFVSIVVKEVMFQITKKTAVKIKSVSLMANAWHHRSDALSSVGSFIGVLCSRLGFLMGDALAGLIISGFIIKVAVEIFIDSVNKLTDKACDTETEQSIRETALATDGVKGIDSLKTRQFGNKIYVDIEISADGRLTLENAHEIAEKVHDNIEKISRDIKHCMVHVNPK